jgi:hypothetical protein
MRLQGVNGEKTWRFQHYCATEAEVCGVFEPQSAKLRFRVSFSAKVPTMSRASSETAILYSVGMHKFIPTNRPKSSIPFLQALEPAVKCAFDGRSQILPFSHSWLLPQTTMLPRIGNFHMAGFSTVWPRPSGSDILCNYVYRYEGTLLGK